MRAAEKNQINQYAAQLLHEAETPLRFPLPLESIAAFLGFTLHFFLPDIDVADTVVTFSHANKLFYINQNCTALQHYNGIARVLGHIVIYGAHRDYISLKQPDLDFHKERQLDFFARALLMPATVFKEKWSQQNIIQLAEFFAVTPTMVLARAQDLTLEAQRV